MSADGDSGFEATLARLRGLLHGGRPQECLEACAEAQARFSARPMLLHLQGQALLACARPVEAEAVFLRLKADHPHLPFGCDGLVQACYAQRKWRQCVEAADAALRMNPNRPGMLCMAGVALLMLEQYPRLRQVLADYLRGCGIGKLPSLRKGYFSRQAVVTPCLAELYGKACLACHDLEQGLAIFQDMQQYKEESAAMQQLYGAYADIIPAFGNSILY